MLTDDTARELAAAMRESAAATFKLAAVMENTAARLRPTDEMTHTELATLAEKQLLREPPAFDPTTHQGAVEQKVRTMLAMKHGE